MITRVYKKLVENISPLLFISILFVASFAINADDSENVEEIVVKGNVLYADQVNALKTPVPILDVPQTVSIVTDDDIRKQGFRGIGDIIRYIPGVNTSQGEGHRDSVVFRGVRSTADFFQDGIRDWMERIRTSRSTKISLLLRIAH